MRTDAEQAGGFIHAAFSAVFSQAIANAVQDAKTKASPADHIVRFIADVLVDGTGCLREALLPSVRDFIESGMAVMPSMLKYHMLSCIEGLSASAETVAAFNAIGGPMGERTHPDGAQLVRMTLRRGEAQRALSPREIRLAVMISLLSLVRQGGVGSCWLTATQVRNHQGLAPDAKPRELRQFMEDFRCMLEIGALPFAALSTSDFVTGGHSREGQVGDELAPLNMAFSSLRLYRGGKEDLCLEAERKIRFQPSEISLDGDLAKSEMLHSILDSIDVPSNPAERGELIAQAIQCLPLEGGRTPGMRSGSLMELVAHVIAPRLGILRADVPSFREPAEPGISALRSEFQRILSIAEGVYASFFHAPMLKCRELTIPSIVGWSAGRECSSALCSVLESAVNFESNEKFAGLFEAEFDWGFIHSVSQELMRRVSVIIDATQGRMGYRRLCFAPRHASRGVGKAIPISSAAEMTAVLVEIVEDGWNVSMSKSDKFAGHRDELAPVLRELLMRVRSPEFMEEFRSEFISGSSAPGVPADSRQRPWMQYAGESEVESVVRPDRLQRVVWMMKGSLLLGRLSKPLDVVGALVELLRERESDPDKGPPASNPFLMMGGTIGPVEDVAKSVSRSHGFGYLPHHPALAGSASSTVTPREWVTKALSVRDQCRGMRSLPTPASIIDEVVELCLAECPPDKRPAIKAWRDAALAGANEHHGMYRVVDLMDQIRPLVKFLKPERGDRTLSYQKIKDRVSNYLMRALDGKIIPFADTNHGRGNDPVLLGIGFDFLSGKVKYWEFNEYADPGAKGGLRLDNVRIDHSWYGTGKWTAAVDQL
jgi:hypothetical protein